MFLFEYKMRKRIIYYFGFICFKSQLLLLLNFFFLRGKEYNQRRLELVYTLIRFCCAPFSIRSIGLDTIGHFNQIVNHHTNSIIQFRKPFPLKWAWCYCFTIRKENKQNSNDNRRFCFVFSSLCLVHISNRIDKRMFWYWLTWMTTNMDGWT